MAQLIAFTGPAGSGKSTAARAVGAEIGAERIAFADTLKAMLRVLYGDLGMLPERCHALLYGDAKGEWLAELGGRSSRHAMQTLGTEWGRHGICADLWVRSWRWRAASWLREGVPVVVDDVRFPNEAVAVRELGGVVVALAGRGGIGAEHLSETASWADLGDVVVENAGDCVPEDLARRVLVAVSRAELRETGEDRR